MDINLTDGEIAYLLALLSNDEKEFSLREGIANALGVDPDVLRDKLIQGKADRDDVIRMVMGRPVEVTLRFGLEGM